MPTPDIHPEEAKVRELFQAYQQGGKEGLKKVLERRDAERLQSLGLPPKPEQPPQA